MATESRIYKGKRWQRIREAVMKRDHGICYFCHKPILEYATIHHLQEINDLNCDNENITYNLDNLVACHRDCHNIHHDRFGKSEYVDADLNINYRRLRKHENTVY